MTLAVQNFVDLIGPVESAAWLNEIDALRLRQVTNFGYYVDSGSINALAVTIAAPQVFAYVDGAQLTIKVAVTSTGNVTLNVNGLGPKAVGDQTSAQLAASSLIAGVPYVFTFTSSFNAFVVSSPAAVSTGLFGNGTVANPAIAFASSPGTGLYRIAADSIGLATAGALRFSVDATGHVSIATPTGAGASLGFANTGSNPGIDINHNNSAVGSPAFRILNGNVSGQTCLDIFANANALTSRFRSDFTGSLNMVAFGATHVFWTGGDSGTGVSRLQIGLGGATNVQFPTVGTTASAANAFLDNANSNNLLRSTSSRKYKTDIEELPAMVSEKLYSLRPIRYKSIAENDDKTVWWYGLVAEEVAEVEPRLVHWSKELIGVVESEVRGSPAIPVYGAEIPDGVQYDRVAVLLLAEVQKLRREVNQIKGHA